MRFNWISGLGAPIAATLASVCCIGPVVLAGLGVGSVGFAAALTPYRPYFLGLTAILLGFAFWQAYRPGRKKKEDCCDVPAETKQKMDRFRKGLLWTVAGFSILAAAFPTLQVQLLAITGESAAASVAARAPVYLDVQGMTCAGCAYHVESALTDVAGVERAEVDYETGEAVVYTDQPPPDIETLIQAVERTGYRAQLQVKE